MADLYVGKSGSVHVSEDDYTGNKGKITSRTLVHENRSHARVFKILCMLDTGVAEKCRREIESALGVQCDSLRGDIDVTTNGNEVRLFISERVDELRKDVRQDAGLRDLRQFCVKVIEKLSEQLEGTELNDIV